MAPGDVLAEVDRMRVACERDSQALMRAITMCMSSGVHPPDWLRDKLGTAVARVSNGYCSSWDEALGRPWPKGARLQVVREYRRLVPLVHAKVWDLCTGESARRVGTELFEDIALMPGVNACRAKVAKAYYMGLKEGWPNVTASPFYGGGKKRRLRPQA